jgi:hypothetical protein
VGVEHLLRDIKDTTVGSLSQRITNQLMGLKGLSIKLREMRNYLQQVFKGILEYFKLSIWCYQSALGAVYTCDFTYESPYDLVLKVSIKLFFKNI